MGEALVWDKQAWFLRDYVLLPLDAGSQSLPGSPKSSIQCPFFIDLLWSCISLWDTRIAEDGLRMVDGKVRSTFITSKAGVGPVLPVTAVLGVKILPPSRPWPVTTAGAPTTGCLCPFPGPLVGTQHVKD